MVDLKKYPEKLVKDRHQLEGNFIFTLWKEPDLYGEYGKDLVVGKDIVTSDGMFYFALGLEMYKANYSTFDEVSIYSQLKGNEILIKGFESRGGYKTVRDITGILDTLNVDAYFDALIKNNTLMNLHDQGFNVMQDFDKFERMTTSDVYDYFEFKLNNTFLKRGGGVRIEDFDITDEFLEECDSGEGKGLSYGKVAPIMNYHTLGIHKSNVQVFAGFSGTGKSSFAVASYIMPILQQGEKITIIANEMNIKAWQLLYLATLLSSEFGYYGITRKKIKTGNFTEEEWEWLHKAQKFHRDNYFDQLKFVKIYDYSIEEVKRIIRRQKKLGFDYVLYDTFKAENAASTTVTGELIEASKTLLQVAEKDDVAIIITMQLVINMENTRYLTAQTLSNAKGVKEVVSELILMRKLWEDEYTGEINDVKPFRLKRDGNGKLTNVKEYMELDTSKKYRIMFINKTRNDEDDLCILFRFDGAWNKWTEIGYCTPKFQNRM